MFKSKYLTAGMFVIFLFNMACLCGPLKKLGIGKKEYKGTPIVSAPTSVDAIGKDIRIPLNLSFRGDGKARIRFTKKSFIPDRNQPSSTNRAWNEFATPAPIIIESKGKQYRSDDSPDDPPTLVLTNLPMGTMKFTIIAEHVVDKGERAYSSYPKTVTVNRLWKPFKMEDTKNGTDVTCRIGMGLTQSKSIDNKGITALHFSGSDLASIQYNGKSYPNKEDTVTVPVPMKSLLNQPETVAQLSAPLGPKVDIPIVWHSKKQATKQTLIKCQGKRTKKLPTKALAAITKGNGVTLAGDPGAVGKPSAVLLENGIVRAVVGDQTDPLQSVDAVAIWKSTQKTLQTCKYSGNLRIHRKRHYVNLTLFNRRTGEVISTKKFSGPKPTRCPRVYRAKVGQNNLQYLRLLRTSKSMKRWIAKKIKKL